jgi:hypothetical protein
MSGQHHAPAALYPRGRAPGTHCIGGWVGPRAGRDTEVRGKILCLRRGSNPGRPLRSQTLYWLRYPAHSLKPENKKVLYWVLKMFTIALQKRHHCSWHLKYDWLTGASRLQRTATWMGPPLVTPILCLLIQSCLYFIYLYSCPYLYFFLTFTFILTVS